MDTTKLIFWFQKKTNTSAWNVIKKIFCCVTKFSNFSVLLFYYKLCFFESTTFWISENLTFGKDILIAAKTLQWLNTISSLGNPEVSFFFFEPEILHKTFRNQNSSHNTSNGSSECFSIHWYWFVKKLIFFKMFIAPFRSIKTVMANRETNKYIFFVSKKRIKIQVYGTWDKYLFFSSRNSQFLSFFFFKICFFDSTTFRI